MPLESVLIFLSNSFNFLVVSFFVLKYKYTAKLVPPTRGDQTYLPKPVMETLGKPNSIKFSLKNGKVIITSGD